MISRTLSLTSTAGSPRRGSSTDRNIGKGAAGTPLPSPQLATGPRCLNCGAPLLDVMGEPPYLLRRCQCRKLRRSDLADGAALLFCVLAIVAWGCI